MTRFDNLRLDHQLCFALYSATNSITRLYRNLLSEHKLTYPQYLVLLVLWERDGVAIKDVIQRLKLESGTLSPIIKRMQGAGLVDKRRSQRDDRVVNLFLTEKARQLEPLVAGIQNQVACHTGLSSEEIFVLIDQLGALSDKLTEQPQQQPASA